MKKVLGLALIGIFFISIGLAGCGYVKKEEFMPEYNKFKADNSTEHEQINGSVDKLDKKVDDQKSSLEDTIDEAKNEAVAASEQGDADTIDTAQSFAEKQDSNLRAEIEDSIQKAKDDAKQFSKSGDKDLKAEINKVSKNTRSNLSRLRNQLSEGTKVLEDTQELAKKGLTEKVATVYFASAKADLADESKEEVETAVRMIKGKGDDWVVKIVGHADARPVLSGKYRSNLDLSYARAVSVKDYLVEKGVTHKIEVTARGYFEPVVAPDAQKGQKENRRVEVIAYAPND